MTFQSLSEIGAAFLSPHWSLCSCLHHFFSIPRNTRRCMQQRPKMSFTQQGEANKAMQSTDN